MSALRNKSKGFTLVELLVVISIIAILSVIGMTVFSGVQKGARDAKRRGDLDAIRLALEQYKAQNGSYPTAGTSNWCWQTLPCWSTGDASSGNLGPLLTPNFIQSLPKDPAPFDDGTCGNAGGNVACHLYHYCSADGTYFILGVNLENNTTQASDATCNLAGNGRFYIKNQQ